MQTSACRQSGQVFWAACEQYRRRDGKCRRQALPVNSQNCRGLPCWSAEQIAPASRCRGGMSLWQEARLHKLIPWHKRIGRDERAAESFRHLQLSVTPRLVAHGRRCMTRETGRQRVSSARWTVQRDQCRLLIPPVQSAVNCVSLTSPWRMTNHLALSTASIRQLSQPSNGPGRRAEARSCPRLGWSCFAITSGVFWRVSPGRQDRGAASIASRFPPTGNRIENRPLNHRPGHWRCGNAGRCGNCRYA